MRGVPVLLAPSWWLGAVLLTVLYAPLVTSLLPGAGPVSALLLAATLAVLLGVSVLIHELAHCAVALWLRVPVLRVRLFLLGGLSELARRPAGPRDEGLIAVAGPLVSVLLAVLSGAGWSMLEPGGALWLLVAEVAVANAAVGLFNLLPGLPLDGGRVLRALIWMVTGRRRVGTAAAVVGSAVVAVGLLVWALSGLATGVPGGWLRLGVCALLAWFVVSGATTEAIAEHSAGWPDGLAPAALVCPVLQLPAESPVSDTLVAAAGRGVVLVRADGVAAGLLDLPAAERLAAVSPRSPAEQAAEPIRPEAVLLASDPGEEVLERVRGSANRQLLVVDADGRPVGVLHRADVERALAAQG
ncbi:MAG: site-2 protease family protein [Pseudonocardiaceae bacterium]|nr:site-2 protease family protein [Pseudonocardiaceae bacterium]